MTRPGVVVTSRAEPPPRSAPTDAGVAFMVGNTSKGAVDAVSSMGQYETVFGTRSGQTAMWDAADAFFREGGARLYVSPTGGGTVDDALEALPRSLGPGQVFTPGATDTGAELLAHAAANNRVALMDAAADADAAALIAAAEAFSADANARYGALFAPAAIVPGVATGGSTRTVPYSAVEAGIIARNDASYSPNVAAAGVNGQSKFATDLSVAFTDAEREALNDAGVNIARIVYDGVRTYGYRTVADLSTGWGLLSNARLNMEIVAKAEAVAENYVFAQLDGRRVKISQFGADLTGMLVPYFEAGSLFGETVDDAFYVDVGAQVNTLESIAAGELRAVIGLRMSPFAELVTIEIVKVAVETPLAVAA